MISSIMILPFVVSKITANSRIRKLMSMLIVFEISCLIKGPSGGFKAFNFTSDSTFDDLIDLAAEKIRSHPRHLRLRYRVGTPVGKGGQDGTDITTTEELKLFVEHMRPQIVPQRTATGKISNRVLKPVRVYFVDGSENECYDDEGSNKRGTKKVRTHLFNEAHLLSTIQKVTSSHMPMENSNLTEVRSKREMVIEKLQTIYYCNIHTEGTSSGSKGRPVHCWPDPNHHNMHYAILPTNFNFWALQIVSHHF
jgi:hypothetical protein